MEYFGVFAAMRQHGGMERFGTKCGSPPLEEIDGICAHGHMREGITDNLTLAFAHIEGFPLHRRSGVLHHIPRFAKGERIHERVGADELVKMRLAFVEIMVVGHEIHFLGPIRIVHAALVGGNHEVRGEWLAGAYLGDGVPLGFVEVQQGIVAETFVIELLTGIHHGIGPHESRKQHFIERMDLLPPESGSPRLVEHVNRSIAGLAPYSERLQCVVRIIVTIVPTVFVAHMPGGHVRIGAITFGQFTAHGQRVFLEYRAIRTPRLARSRTDRMTVLVSRENLRMRFVQP